jgi:hypothetical protein
VPFIRYTRDKRGYECTMVMHAYRGANGASRTRVLYVFRSPSTLRVGRQPLDPEVREALEHTHPDLAFDWQTLQREPAVARAEPKDRGSRPAPRQTPRPESDARPVSEAAQPEAFVEDESLLGRTLGAREAARLRAAYRDLLARIVRRARTPEERDRLTERALRLNPDDWPDEAAIAVSVGTIETEWRAISAELPHRRRGRRGRPRFAAAEPHATVPDSGVEGDPEASGIINDDHPKESHDTELLASGPGPEGAFADDAGEAGGDAGSGNGGAVGADARRSVGTTGPDAGPDASETAADSTDPGVPGRD